jgi:hypothetical protein
VKLGKNAILVKFSPTPVGEKLCKMCFEWHKRFKEGRENVENDERSGCACPRTHKTDENVENMRNMVHSDRRLSIRAMDVQLNLDKQAARKA